MATVFKTFATEHPARQAVEALSAAAVPGRDIRLINGCRRHDVRLEPVGGFAGPVGPHAPVGRFAGRAGQRWQGTGAFVGDADRQRQGSFGDVDRYLIVEYGDEAERSRIAAEREVRRLCSDPAPARMATGSLTSSNSDERSCSSRSRPSPAQPEAGPRRARAARAWHAWPPHRPPARAA